VRPTIRKLSEDRYGLFGNESSYHIKLFKNRYPLHLHWGARIDLQAGMQGSQAGNPVPQAEKDLFPLFPAQERGYMINSDPDDPSFYIEELQREYGYGETGDFRPPAFEARDADNYPITGPFELTARLLSEKPRLEGLPSARSGEGEELQTLELKMDDAKSGLRITLYYTSFPDYDLIARSAVFTNTKDEVLTIERAMSVSFDMPFIDQQLLYLHGAWARERSVVKTSLNPGLFRIGSVRGTSSHQFNPFCALMGPESGEHRGEVFGIALVYSGNFTAEVERNYDDNLRVNMGIHPEKFEWKLEPGETFSTPEALLVYSPDGLNGMSDRYHRFVRERIFPPGFYNTARPVLFNNWEATYFDFDEKKLEALAEKAADLGVELFVLDDGWFGERESDETSLGDWYTNEKKLPGGLVALGKNIESLGMVIGLWVEPEMVSRNSKLFEKHPDWCLHIPGRPVAEGRKQLILDLTREEVQEFIIKTLDGILSSAPISYVKWDMNRYLANVASISLSAQRQKELYHRYVLGLYRVLEEVTAAHPDVLFEGCSGGGGRFDLGILYYMPQYWTSDNTDAISRLKIQYGTSMIFPPVSMGAHVSAVPNHQVGRITPLQTRADVAFGGNFGYELDINELNEEDSEQIRRQISFYKRHRNLIQFGRFIRLMSPFETEEAAWMFLSEDEGEILLFMFSLYREANRPTQPRRVRLTGLSGGQLFEEEKSGIRYSSEELTVMGMPFPQTRSDFESRRIYMRRVGE